MDLELESRTTKRARKTTPGSPDPSRGAP